MLMTQIMNRQTTKKRAMGTLSLLGIGAVAAALSGCGGASTTNNPVVATPDSGPVVYGLNALGVISGVQLGETSGLAITSPDGTAEGVLTGAFSYKTTNGAGPLPAYVSDFAAGIPLGFGNSGVYFNDAASVPIVALPTNYTGTLVFGAYISTGALKGSPVGLNTSSVVLTSSEAPSFSEQLTFDPAYGSGVLSQASYKTAPFAVPAFLQTTGLHDLHTTVADTSGQSSTTDFVAAAVAPTDVALFLQSLTVNTPATTTAAATTTNTAITPGDTVTIDGGPGIGVYPTGYAPTTADDQGTAVLFTTPGTHTVTESDPKGVTVQTETFTLTADTAGTTILAPPTPDGAPTGAIRVVHPAAKRTFKH